MFVYGYSVESMCIYTRVGVAGLGDIEEPTIIADVRRSTEVVGLCIALIGVADLSDSNGVEAERDNWTDQPKSTFLKLFIFSGIVPKYSLYYMLLHY